MLCREIFEGKAPQHELFSDGRTVWINGSDGSNIARFGRWGIDVHNPVEDQMKGAPQCLACTHERTNLDDWRRFQNLVKQHFGITVTDQYMPNYIRRAFE